MGKPHPILVIYQERVNALRSGECDGDLVGIGGGVGGREGLGLYTIYRARAWMLAPQGDKDVDSEVGDMTAGT